MDMDQDDFTGFIKKHYPHTIKSERPDGSLELKTSIYFKSLEPKKKSAVILIGNFNILYYGADIQFVLFAGKDTVWDIERIKAESLSILAEENFYLYSKHKNSLKFFDVYRCRFIEDNPDVISFFKRVNPEVKDVDYELKCILVFQKVPTLKSLGVNVSRPR